MSAAAPAVHVSRNDHPRADGRRYIIDVTSARETGVTDQAHTDRVDNFTSFEITLKSRNHGNHLESMIHDITPAGQHYLLIHYDVPTIDESTYSIKIHGCVNKPLVLDLDNIRRRPSTKAPVMMECAGNGRLHNKTRLWQHVPWADEAIGCAMWGGTPLRGVLEEAGIAADAVDVVFTGRDKGIQGGEVQQFQRSLSIEHAMKDEVMLVYEMNSQPLLPQHGFPLRLIVPGWVGCASVKWLESIELIAHKFEGHQMKAYSFAVSDNDPNRVPCTDQRVRALMIPPGIPDFFTRLRYVEASECIELRGRAWVGHAAIRRVEVSVDGGKTWAAAALDTPIGEFAWIGWRFQWRNASTGEHTLRVRATDSNGNTQNDDDTSATNYYSMDTNRPQFVDVVVVPAGALANGNRLKVPLQFPTL